MDGSERRDLDICVADGGHLLQRLCEISGCLHESPYGVQLCAYLACGHVSSFSTHHSKSEMTT